MDAAVVYESLFGNTRAVAEAIAAGITDADPVARVMVMRVAEAKPRRAARPIARSLRRHCYRLAAAAEGFIVTGMGGPLRDGELERARSWGAALVRQAAQLRIAGR